MLQHVIDYDAGHAARREIGSFRWKVLQDDAARGGDGAGAG